MGFLKSHPILVAVVVLVGTMGAIQLIHEPNTWVVAEKRAVAAVVVLAVMAAVGGLVTIKPSGVGMGYAFCKGSFVLVIAVVLSAFSLLGCLFDPTVNTRSDAMMMLAANICMCLAVGVFEEGLFRGLVFGALLSKMGGTRSGVVWAAVISGLVFGIAHVYGYFLFGYITDALTFGQAVVKAIQSSAIGFFFAAVYLRTRNLWAVALVHGLFDLIALLAISFFDISTNITYVSTDASLGMLALVFNLVVTLAYIPALIYAYRALRSADVPNLGIWRETWEPVVPAENPKRKA